jgi:hypothetical protein
MSKSTSPAIHARKLPWAAALILSLLFVAVLPRCVSDSGGALLVDGGVTHEDGGVIFQEGGALYAVAGTVSGLSASSSLTLTLNGLNPLSVKNGAFAFPAVLSDGEAWSVAIATPAPGFTCTIANGKGTVMSAAVTNVAVTCLQSDATLSALTLSAAQLSPAFSPTTLAYSAGARVSGITSAVTQTTITATTSNPNAKITIAGAVASSGVPSAPMTVKQGPNPIDVTVVAPDGTTTTHYAIALAGLVNDYFKASTTSVNAGFGGSVALSTDGNTLAVGAPGESSHATGINGNQADKSAPGAGAVYVFRRSSSTWTQEAYVKASNTSVCIAETGPTCGDAFGSAVALSSDGSTLAVGAPSERNQLSGIDVDGSDTSLQGAGAVYVFTRAGATWTQQAYVKSSLAMKLSVFGYSVALSSDGNTLAVGEPGNPSATNVINGSQADNSQGNSGAAYVLLRTGTTWAYQAYIKASNTRGGSFLGASIALSSDGNTLAVGASNESSNATGVGGDQTDQSAGGAGAAFVFSRAGTTWTQQEYIKATNTHYGTQFGNAIALSSDGNTLAVGSFFENGNAKGIPANPTAQLDTSAMAAGAAYVYTRAGAAWSSQAYVKATNTRSSAQFGSSVTLSADGSTLVVGSKQESSNAKGVDGDQTNNSAAGTGAAYSYTRAGTTWSTGHYLKPSNGGILFFGASASISGDAKTLAIGAPNDSSKATGLNGNQNDVSMSGAGAADVF